MRSRRTSGTVSGKSVRQSAGVDFSPRTARADGGQERMRELRRKDKALAKAAALRVLSKKVQAIFNKDKGEDA